LVDVLFGDSSSIGYEYFSYMARLRHRVSLRPDALRV
jgi:hypothetical protein